MFLNEFGKNFLRMIIVDAQTTFFSEPPREIFHQVLDQLDSTR